MPEQANRKRKDVEEDLVVWPPQVSGFVGSGQWENERAHSDQITTPSYDYVNALVLSDAGKAMIFEPAKHGGGFADWQVVGAPVPHGDDPMTAVRRTLLEETGYSSDHWLYLCSYVMTDSAKKTFVGHFFCARNARPVAKPRRKLYKDMNMRWVSQRDLKYALLDGRISVLSYAITISMALLTVLE